MSKLRFCFQLDAVEDIHPWGEGNDRKLHWFGLTSGRYWISTPLGEVLRYTNERQQLWDLASPYADYQVARFFEDLQTVLPFALEPVPSDIAAVASNSEWHDRSVAWMESIPLNDDKLDLWYAANWWWSERHIDSAHLSHGPYFNFWRIDDQVFIRWEERSKENVWTTPDGQLAIDVTEFQIEAHRFLDEVLTQMDQRVESIRTKGWTRTDCSLDIESLVQEQSQRAASLHENKSRRALTDWSAVRSSLECLQSELQ